jgi:hypothetical protein
MKRTHAFTAKLPGDRGPGKLEAHLFLTGIADGRNCDSFSKLGGLSTQEPIIVCPNCHPEIKLT